MITSIFRLSDRELTAGSRYLVLAIVVAALIVGIVAVAACTTDVEAPPIVEKYTDGSVEGGESTAPEPCQGEECGLYGNVSVGRNTNAVERTALRDKHLRIDAL